MSIARHRLDRQKLSTEPREMGGRRVISQCKQWYFAKVKSVVKYQIVERPKGLNAVNVQLA